MKAFHACFSIWLRVYVKDESAISFLISGLTNAPPLIFASLCLGNFPLKNWNAELSSLKRFTKFLMGADLMYKGGKIICSDSIKSYNLLFFVPSKRE